MVGKRYIPDRGDVVWVSLDPSLGHEQQGRRPVLIVSHRSYNAAASLALACPITSHIKGYPFEVKIIIKKMNSVVLVDHIRSIYWRERKAQKILSAPAAVVEETQELLNKLISS